MYKLSFFICYMYFKKCYCVNWLIALCKGLINELVKCTSTVVVTLYRQILEGYIMVYGF